MTGLKVSLQPVGELRLAKNSYSIERCNVLIQMH